MKISTKIILLFCVVIFLVFAGSSASAITEGTGDVFHYKKIGDSWSWESYSGDKPDIDLTSVDYSVSGSNITVTLTVSGSIQTSEKFYYYIYLTNDQGKYFAFYINGFPSWVGSEGYSGEGGLITEYTVSGNTFTATFNPTNPSSSFDVYGCAWELTSNTDMETAEWWADYAPTVYAPWYTADGDDGNGDNPPAASDGEGDDGDADGTPGFEMIILIAAISVALMIWRRKK